VHLLKDVASLWEGDGLRLLEFRWLPDKLQVLFSTTPEVSPVFLAARAKGRLDHAIRKAGLTMPLSRKVSVRAVGDNTRRDVEAYIESQVEAAGFVDERFSQSLDELQVVRNQVDLAQPLESSHGRYWYNLHLVLVTEGRRRIVDIAALRALHDAFLRIVAKKQHVLSRLAVMPDHVHAALRPQIEETPLNVVFAYQNNLAHMLGARRMWQDGYYVGTFGEYTTDVVRQRAEE
jgi:REP element-mobilizing transposase RayT